MTDYCYPECTTAALTAMSVFHRLYPSYHGVQIEKAIRGAIGYIHASQLPEGGWHGSWAVCFTYATMFALESLALNNETYDTSQPVKRACTFLLGKQMKDGGWGESYKACETKQWVNHESSLVVNTAWAVIALLVAKCPDTEAIKRGCHLIMSRQQPNGEWLRETASGIFNKTCAIDYALFPQIWTAWALGKAAKELHW